MTVRVVVADARRLVRESLREALAADERVEVVASAGDARGVFLQVQRTTPDVVALAGSGLGPLSRLCGAIASVEPAPRVLVVDGTGDEDALLDAIEAGVDGYVTSGSGIADVIGAVRALASGESVVPPVMLGPLLRKLIRRHREASAAVGQLAALTPREREVLTLLVEGLDDERMAARLFISPDTARTHVQRILRKLGVHSRKEAVALVADNGLAAGLERVVEGRAS